MNSERTALRARWVFAGDAPLADASIFIESGRISDVTTCDVAGAINLGNAAIVPGLVNAHTHLEFSHLAEPVCPARPFDRWIDGVVAARRNSDVPRDERIRRGYDELLACGTAGVGEIATSPASGEMLAAGTIPAVAFHEVIGLRPDPREALAELHTEFAKYGEQCLVTGGVSPHAPYSVHPKLLRAIIDDAVEHGAPVAMHLAETQSELELLRTQTGGLREMLERYSLWPGDIWDGHRTILDYLRILAECPRSLVIHGNYLTNEEIAFLSTQPRMSVVFCPRTHAYFGHESHPWRRLLEAGVNVALGTDGRCSNPDLSVWNEALYLRRQFPDVSPKTLLDMVTVAGARALGLSETVGSITVGAPARLSIIRGLPEGAAEPFTAVFQPGTFSTPLPV